MANCGNYKVGQFMIKNCPPGVLYLYAIILWQICAKIVHKSAAMTIITLYELLILITYRQ